MENKMIQIEEGQEIVINCDQKIKFFKGLDGSLTMYHVINDVEYHVVIPNKAIEEARNSFKLEIDCKLFMVGTN
jgi:hypothetical protein